MSDSNDAILSAINAMADRMGRVEDALVSLARIEERHEALETRIGETCKRTRALERENVNTEVRLNSLEVFKKAALIVLCALITPALGALGLAVFNLL